MKTIKSRREFERVFKGGVRTGNRLLRITAEVGGDEELQLAFVAPKRLGNAVYRNRCKRVMREAALRCDLPQKGCKLILFATRATHDCSLDDLTVALSSLVKRLTYGAE